MISLPYIHIGVLLFGGIAPRLIAATTIDPVEAHAYGSNIGWLNASSAEGNAEIGEFYCSGAIYGANVGWISLGKGSPSNGHAYGNASADDYGVNVSYAKEKEGHQALLRGMAYGANIGWISFEANGHPHVDLRTGRLHGSAWSANAGWIKLDGTQVTLRTRFLSSGPDQDDDGIPDAWEHRMAGHLALGDTEEADADEDGMTDREEYLADTDPSDPASSFRITTFIAPRILPQQGEKPVTDLAWTVSLSRTYSIEAVGDLLAPWKVLMEDLHGSDTYQQIVRFEDDSTGARFYRVRVHRPLSTGERE